MTETAGATGQDLYHTDWPVVGHGWAIAHVTRALSSGRLRHAYLINGPAQIGKTTFARAMAMAVLCVAESGRPCGQCRPCTLMRHGTHVDVSTVEADGRTLKIDQLREMQRLLVLRPVESQFRVVILRRFNEATGPAMDSLLKTLEEPPSYALLLLTADTADSLLPTIRSRCQPINLRPIPVVAVRNALETHFGIESEHAALLAQLSGGRLGWALRVLDDESLLAQRAEWLDKLESALDQNRTERFGLAENMSRDRESLTTALGLWLSYWRDVMLLNQNSATPITNRDRLHALEQIARGVSIEGIYQAIAAIRRTMLYAEHNVNVRLALDVLMLDLPRLRLYASPPGGAYQGE